LGRCRDSPGLTIRLRNQLMRNWIRLSSSSPRFRRTGFNCIDYPSLKPGREGGDAVGKHGQREGSDTACGDSTGMTQTAKVARVVFDLGCVHWPAYAFETPAARASTLKLHEQTQASRLSRPVRAGPWCSPREEVPRWCRPGGLQRQSLPPAEVALHDVSRRPIRALRRPEQRWLQVPALGLCGQQPPALPFTRSQANEASSPVSRSGVSAVRSASVSQAWPRRVVRWRVA
jgi:hypothetical protein